MFAEINTEKLWEKIQRGATGPTMKKGYLAAQNKSQDSRQIMQHQIITIKQKIGSLWNALIALWMLATLMIPKMMGHGTHQMICNTNTMNYNQIISELADVDLKDKFVLEFESFASPELLVKMSTTDKIKSTASVIRFLMGKWDNESEQWLYWQKVLFYFITPKFARL